MVDMAAMAQRLNEMQQSPQWAGALANLSGGDAQAAMAKQMEMNALQQNQAIKVREMERQKRAAEILPQVLDKALALPPADGIRLISQTTGLSLAEAAQQFMTMQKAMAPVAPATTGLPEGYRWNEDMTQAVPIAGITPQGAKPMSPKGKLKADLDAGLITQEDYDAATRESPPEFKQYELSAAAYGARMNEALSAVEDLESSGDDFFSETGAFLDNIGLETAANIARSPSQQTYQNAADEWIRAKLRKESGAVIGDDEMAKEYTTYFPQRGDSKQVIAQKKKLRQRATETMKKQSGKAYDYLYGGNNLAEEADTPEGVPQEVSELWEFMTPEERALWQ